MIAVVILAGFLAFGQWQTGHRLIAVLTFISGLGAVAIWQAGYPVAAAIVGVLFMSGIGWAALGFVGRRILGMFDRSDRLQR